MIVSSVISRPVQVSVLSNTYAVDIAALKAADVSEMAGNTQISVAGYYAPGDGGGGIFYYDAASSATDNGGTIIAPTAGSGRWKRIYSGAVNVRWFGANGDGVTDDTASIQAAADSGDILIPAGNFKHGPLSISSSVKFLEGSSVTPIFTTDTSETFYDVQTPNVTIDGLRISGILIGSTTANKYIVNIAADNCRVANIRLSGLTAGDGDLKVVHGVYVQSCSGAVVENCTINDISGAAVFIKIASFCTVRNNHITDTRWYSITLDHTCTDCHIANNTIDGNNVNARYYGGSINLMSQLTGTPNRRITVTDNKITGVHNYGACIRVLSCHDSIISGNIIHDCIPGALMAGERLQYIGSDRRGSSPEVSGDNGPCTNLIITGNNLIAGTGSHIGIYIKNQGVDSGGQFENISVLGNIICSISESAAFENGIIVHGYTSGFKGLTIKDNILSLLTVAGSIVGGGIGVTSTDVRGDISSLRVEGNVVRDISSATPSISAQTGIYISGFETSPVVRGNTIKNFYYGVRTASATITDPVGFNDNTFLKCGLNALYSSNPVGGGFDMSMGTALPVTGRYVVGHIRQKTDAAASASWGWIVTTAGGAMTAAWASGQTYVAGTWYRNSSGGRVYELITAGGGTTSVEPTGTTVGGDETGADGYVWRCRATTSARWATLPTLGAVVALP